MDAQSATDQRSTINDQRSAISRIAERFIAVSLGALLLVAAGLKLYGLGFSPIPSVDAYVSPRVQLAVVIWECMLGIWLVWGEHRPVSWLAAILTFSAFAAISASFLWYGVTSCGCFGSVETSPWAVFVLDIVAILLLSIFCPTFSKIAKSSKQIVQSWGVTVAIVVVFVIAGVIFSTIRYGSVEAAIAKARNDTIVLETDPVDCGSGQPGDILNAKAIIKNWSDHPIRLIGGTSDCSCITTLDLPAKVQPGESYILRLQIQVPREGKEGELFARIVEITTADDAIRTLKLGLNGRVSNR